MATANTATTITVTRIMIDPHQQDTSTIFQALSISFFRLEMVASIPPQNVHGMEV